MPIYAATIPKEIVECIARDRKPTPLEIRRVADHIWRDIRVEKSGADARMADDANARRPILKAARAALAGSG